MVAENSSNTKYNTLNEIRSNKHSTTNWNKQQVER